MDMLLQHPLILAYSFLRPFGLFVMFPILSSKNLGGALIRNGLVLVFSFPIIAYFLQIPVHSINYDVWPGFGFILNELLIGSIIGFTMAIPFWALDSAGFIVDTIRGASMGTILNPSLGEATSILGILFVQMFMALFFLHGGLDQILESLFHSYQIIPPGHILHFNRKLVDLLMSQWTMLFRLCISFVLPAVVVMVLCDLAIGLINRSAQQLNVFFIAMPVKSALALLMLIVTLVFGFQLYFKEINVFSVMMDKMLTVGYE